MWLIAITAPPVTGRCSTPVTVNFKPCNRHTRRAAWMTVPYTGSTSHSLVLQRPPGGSGYPDTARL
ncbi:sensor histidine kinase [Mycolicibacterium canariasense]|uniref:Sensor histidine kinase n=1 Tax=Mycolicibacterium canariasense TaxID=228230 RepID=A0A117ICD8_MYCCR|nr:sensor histidine kinase [Mycolicibacterium canariasense]